MMEKQFSYNRALINYLLFGKGSSVVICFHGYGENAGSYSFLEKYAVELFTFVSIDLPFHGKTKWPESSDLHPADLVNIAEGILRENGLKNEELTLMGFSLGGRMVLSLYQEISGRIKKIFLLAPDGLKVNFWYWLSTQTMAGNRLFRFTMKHPGWFFGFLKLINFLHLVNPSIFKFVNHYIGDKEYRKLLYLRWTSLRKIKPGINKIKVLIKKNNTQAELVYGKFDRIILSSRGEKFRKGIEDQVSLINIHAGHQVLHEKHVSEILPLLTSNKDNA